MSQDDDWQVTKTRIAIAGARILGLSSRSISAALGLPTKATASDKMHVGALSNSALNAFAKKHGLTLADLLTSGDPQGIHLGLSSKQQSDAIHVFRSLRQKPIANSPIRTKSRKTHFRPLTKKLAR